ncbi:ABC transporter substrate-binding protein [Terribacillus saccharophilus]|uniref:Sugar ABC transporter substrate-binding protein n=1 Tax=Terribacillus saccharophilus TaxID=361277 RepID=A0A075LJS8_9BACI|nr:ABC transporter substrate-binding protein [Terribacillus goriensis]AIF67005.1 sugar ABC transporter substrate-binding protein [Terribacillus goriensis]MEC0283851.1 ABC transporter substrate-binding protein [Terribacillus saccharophilus]MEC0290807.1 ABC transporter substrate-binding protein [Terribacillus saccharophilus]
MKRKSLLLVFGMMMVLLLAACSSEGSSSGSDDGKVKLRIAWWGDQPRNDYTTKVIEMYEEQNPDVQIDAEYASWDDYWQKLSPQAAANELPDIVQMDVSYLAQYAQGNKLADLTPFLGEQIDTSNMTEDYVNGGKIDDGIYGMNTGVNAVGFHYNPELLEELGLGSEIPEDWTWDDYKSMSDKAVAQGAFFDTHLRPDVFFDYYLRSQGSRLYAEDGSGLGYEDDKLFVDYWSMIAEQVEKGATPTPDALAQITGIEDDPVVKGEAIGIFQWSNQFVGLKQVAEKPLEIAPMPGPGTSDGLYLKPGMFFSVSQNSEQKEAAADFLDFFMNDVEANKLILGDRGVPGSSEVKDALKDEVSEAQKQVFEYVEWAETNSSPMGAPDPAGAGEVIELLETLAEQISYGQLAPKEAAESFRTQAEGMLGQ